MSESLKALLVEWRRRFPEISEQEALADLWSQGVKCNETFAAFSQRLANAEDECHNVIKHPDFLCGWHVGWVEKWKPGVLKFFATRCSKYGNSVESMNGFISFDILRVAIETHVINKPNGYSLP